MWKVSDHLLKSAIIQWSRSFIPEKNAKLMRQQSLQFIILFPRKAKSRQNKWPDQILFPLVQKRHNYKIRTGGLLSNSIQCTEQQLPALTLGEQGRRK
ncbi:hypothetical protein GDO78_003438 [Eleutherodactylus coqui]|uniref:Uncharacterized protein n=1 Tax=Eleutherodactylus coqui TaxID=57060 RepID=A0A8J6ETB8_ELECQ|nr:hypothetical protein GDO78_003438 [Eleutherodactylus coqui]